MQRFLYLAAATLLACAVLASCGTINRASSALGLGVEFEEVYSAASTFEERVWLTAGLYEATLDVVISQCEGSRGTPLEAPCVRASQAADRLTPGVAATLDSLALYLEAKADVDRAIAEHGSAPDVLIGAASGAMAKVALEYAGIRRELEAFIRFPG